MARWVTYSGRMGGGGAAVALAAHEPRDRGHRGRCLAYAAGEGGEWSAMLNLVAGSTGRSRPLGRNDGGYCTQLGAAMVLSDLPSSAAGFRGNGRDCLGFDPAPRVLDMLDSCRALLLFAELPDLQAGLFDRHRRRTYARRQLCTGPTMSRFAVACISALQTNRRPDRPPR